MADDPPTTGIDAAFANTIVSTYPDGRTAKLWLDRDGDFRGVGRTGDHYSGKWERKGERLCLRQVRPLPLPFHFCTPIVRGGIGSSWQAKSVTGEPITVTIVTGRDTDWLLASSGVKP